MPAQPDPSTRVYLTVPYAEKDDAKRHGARWDPERKRWWIERSRIATSPGIARWITGDTSLATQAREAEAFLAGPAKGPAAVPTRAAKPTRVDAATSFLLPACSCASPPWEDCEHTGAAR